MYNQEKSVNDMNTSNFKFAVLAIIVLIGLACAFVFGVAVFGTIDSNSTPLITSVLGFVSLGVIGILNTLSNKQAADRLEEVHSKAEESESKIKEVDEKADKLLNGEMEAKIRAVLIDVLNRHEAADRDPSVTIPLPNRDQD